MLNLRKRVGVHVISCCFGEERRSWWQNALSSWWIQFFMFHTSRHLHQTSSLKCFKMPLVALQQSSCTSWAIFPIVIRVKLLAVLKITHCRSRDFITCQLRYGSMHHCNTSLHPPFVGISLGLPHLLWHLTNQHMPSFQPKPIKWEHDTQDPIQKTNKQNQTVWANAPKSY